MHHHDQEHCTINHDAALVLECWGQYEVKHALRFILEMWVLSNTHQEHQHVSHQFRDSTFPTFAGIHTFFSGVSVLNYINFLQKIDQNCKISYFFFVSD